ncbi:Z1 domain-containing protein [Kineococcus auxinigenes]|uniref:Z1 domain-containing protein n=1 Tax=unclassified Kineococcus TaxID=2621656 RepID=UPI003D7EC502
MAGEDPTLGPAWTSFQDLCQGQVPRAAVQMLRTLQVPAQLVDQLLDKHEQETRRIVELREPLAIGRENAAHWYTGPRAGDKNWPAFESRLRKSLGDEAMRKIDAASDKVVAMLDHPATPTFDSRGLVVGHVQSGKTSNFTAVIAKAADRGYRMFIVLSGVHNSLRRQTQSRLVRDVVNLNPTMWHQITKPEHDFVPPANAAAFLAAKDQMLLLVVKKNAPVLRKLKRWLKSASQHLDNVPTLIIDDEADQATVATKTINPLISDILRTLPKSCYVGYTATPFANLLIDPGEKDGFYPRDFILSLERSEEYQGPEKLFGRAPLDGEDPADAPGGLDMIRSVPDEELPHLRPTRQADVPGFTPSITPSLRRAALWFWLATATRRVRDGEARHSSMLVHSHSDTRVHDSYAAPLRALRSEVLTSLGNGDAALGDELHALWTAESARVPASDMGEREVLYEQVRAALPVVVDDTKIILDHYRSTHRLDYDSGPATIIAVGGNTLSRGLTLEGLVVSVFVRSSDVYDTLLQMGRWFGYRPGYTDLPRIWMPNEMREWFTHLATVEEEMRREIDRYIVEHKTPLELAVRIRCHPKMRVTAPSKMKAAVRAAAAYGGQLVESRYFPGRKDENAPAWHQRNNAAVARLLQRAASLSPAESAAEHTGRLLWRGLPTDTITSFLGEYRFHERSLDADADLMTRYIEGRRRAGGLTGWNVAVMGTDPSRSSRSMDLPDGSTVGMVRRTRLQPPAPPGASPAEFPESPIADIKTLTGPRDEAVDLVPSTEKGRSELATLRVKQQPETGLVLLYPIDPDSQSAIEGRAALNVPGDVAWGVALVFPRPSVGVDLEVDYDFVAADLQRAFPGADEDEAQATDVLSEDLDTEAA